MATSVTLKPNAIDISGSTSGTTTLQASAVAGTTTLTLPAATDTLVGKTTTDTLTNKTLTGAAMNGTLGATTPSTASVTTLTTSSTVTHSGGTANGVAYLDGSKVLTTGSALVFDGTNLGVGTTAPQAPFGGRALQLGNTTDSRSVFTLQTTTTGQGSVYFSDGTTGGDTYRGFIDYSHTEDSLILGTAATPRARFNNSGAFVFAGGTTSANGIGITFPATQSASTDANTLDDYEEGTWTPTWSVSGGTIAAVNNEGFYTKVGRQVFVGGYIAYGNSTTGTPTGALSIAGLPFTASTGYGQGGGKQAGRGYAGYNFWGTTPQTTLGIAASGTTLALSAVYTDMSRSFNNSDQVYFFATYFV